jgi:ribosome-associated translation inhibitor RaiA
MTMKGVQTLQVQTEARGAVPESAVEFAVRKVESLLRLAPEPVLFARVRLTMTADPAAPRPAIAQVNLDLNGRMIRAQAAAPAMREAVERMHDRLRIRLERAARNWAAIRGGRSAPPPPEWRQRADPAKRARPAVAETDDATVVRHKSAAPARQTPAEAVTEMELLDYDFYLFTEQVTGCDSVICRAPDGYRLAQIRPQPGRLDPVDTSISVSEQPVPKLTPAAAITRLDALGEPFLFFVDSQTGRGNLIYHRYDGHYGLITPADA